MKHKKDWYKDLVIYQITQEVLKMATMMESVI